MSTKLGETNADDMRAAMVDCQLRTNDVIDPAVVGAMAAVPREAFVPEAMARVAYMDRAIALGHDRFLNPPLVTGRLLAAAMLRPGLQVLLVGGATGYMAALLSALGGQIVAVEEQVELLAAARAASDDSNIHWHHGPLTLGAPDQAPYDRIIIDGAIDAVPDALAAQLVDGGRLVAARRDGAVTRLVQGVKTGDILALRSFADMDVAPLPGFSTPSGFRF